VLEKLQKKNKQNKKADEENVERYGNTLYTVSSQIFMHSIKKNFLFFKNNKKVFFVILLTGVDQFFFQQLGGSSLTLLDSLLFALVFVRSTVLIDFANCYDVRTEWPTCEDVL
jgi:hypothetical protein